MLSPSTRSTKTAVRRSTSSPQVFAAVTDAPSTISPSSAPDVRYVTVVPIVGSMAAPGQRLLGHSVLVRPANSHLVSHCRPEGTSRVR